MGVPQRSKTISTLFNIQSGCCFYCEKEVSLKLKNHPDEATIDHIVPKSKGGKDSPYNFVMACRECNEEKADKSLVVFISQRRKTIKDLLKRSVG